MKLQDIALGAVIGFACGYAAKSAVEKYADISPDAILKKAKEMLKQDGKVIGSWILMTPETYKKNGLSYDVYKGGITRLSENEQKQITFVADASTGTVLDVTEKV